MTAVHPYINFKGKCEEAFNHYKSVFGGEFTMISRYKDMPPSEDYKMGDVDGDLVMHVSLPIGPHTHLMGSDVGGEWAKYTVDGNNVQLSVNAASTEEADRIFNGLAEGGRANMPMANTFWGSYFGMLTDKFGINWMVSYDERQKQNS